MTAKEAIVILEIWLRDIEEDSIATMFDLSDYAKALKLAIEALNHSADDSKKASSSCGQENDLISRRAVIEAARDWYEGLICGSFKGLEKRLQALPSAQTEIIYCKDCVKHNKAHGYYYDGTVIGIKDCCPLVEIRGKAQGHEFDYQFCAYAERRTDERPD